MISYTDLLTGQLRLTDIAIMNDYLDCEAHNENVAREDVR